MTSRVETLQVRPPFDWEGLLSFFAPRAIPGVESVKEGVLRRSFREGADSGVLELRQGRDRGELELEVWGCLELADLALRARRVLDLDCETSEVGQCLGADPVVGPLLRKWPGVRLPGAWDPFEMGVRAVLGQQVSVKAAHTLAGRLVSRFGHSMSSPFPSVTKQFPLAGELATVPVEELASLGLPRKRAETLHHFACWSALPVDERGVLLDLPGIGPWTESYLRMRGQSDRDAFPAGDLGIHKALGIQGLGALKATREAEVQSQAWKPFRAYAVFLLWRSLA
jgi:3-methyladenine DNA glycosylase/8-oxoguanine DNA glycosylase